MTSIFEIDCWLFCDFDNIDINTWDNNRIDKRYLNDIINKAKPYIREYKIKKLLNEKTYI